ncbi:fasciclin domain-containing protein [Flavobacterium turcicum]|uniref:Fasciclin domain-containing protein n=1 Tax=Flavobacterium turcicum TaxID=2764718 RepID=A0ABR7JD95_9FLAO|nr:fasciclin domain-containing protein [Flavobacterium turcicum]MBC5862134.1 fasciclin domain-containing protein [Flavobacterium turcicum]NHL00865.1 fasciclin domain-containing protein [Flavobacterium turcicum]
MKIKNQILSFVTMLAVAFVTFSCSTDEPKEVTPLKSIVEIAKADPANFSILVDALRKTGLESTLTSAGSYTVFAPTNAAFTAAGYSSASINALTAPADNTAINNLRLILQNHVIGLGTRANDLLAAGYTRTFAAVRVPASASSNVNINLFVNKVGTDVLVNGGVANGGAKVTSADIEASNGIVHVVDGVILLPTIVSHIKANPNLSSLLGVVASTAQASVLTTLNGATAAAPLTVYAPENAAFTAATATNGYLVGKSDAQVTSILRYHLENGNRAPSSTTSYSTSADVAITTLFTPNRFTILQGTVKIKDVVGTTNGTVKTFNIQGTNGVVQVIDKVLQPFQ